MFQTNVLPFNASLINYISVQAMIRIAFIWLILNKTLAKAPAEIYSGWLAVPL